MTDLPNRNIDQMNRRCIRNSPSLVNQSESLFPYLMHDVYRNTESWSSRQASSSCTEELDLSSTFPYYGRRSGRHFLW